MIHNGYDEPVVASANVSDNCYSTSSESFLGLLGDLVYEVDDLSDSGPRVSLLDVDEFSVSPF